MSWISPSDDIWCHVFNSSTKGICSFSLKQTNKQKGIGFQGSMTSNKKRKVHTTCQWLRLLHTTKQSGGRIYLAETSSHEDRPSLMSCQRDFPGPKPYHPSFNHTSTHESIHLLFFSVYVHFNYWILESFFFVRMKIVIVR